MHGGQGETGAVQGPVAESLVFNAHTKTFACLSPSTQPAYLRVEANQKASCRKCISLSVLFSFWYGQKRNFWEKSLPVFSIVWVRAKAQNVLSNALARMEGALRSCSFKIPIFRKGSLAITLNYHAHTYTQIILIYTGFHKKRRNLSNTPSSLSPFSRSRTHHTHIHTNSSTLHASQVKSSTVPTLNRGQSQNDRLTTHCPKTAHPTDTVDSPSDALLLPYKK